MHYFDLMTMPPMAVVETTFFKNQADNALSEDERLELISFLASNPEAGAIISGTGGVRKVRWARENEGKSGGFRAIYYFYNEEIPLFALMVYPMNMKDTLTKGEINQLKKLVDELVDQY